MHLFTSWPTTVATQVSLVLYSEEPEGQEVNMAPPLVESLEILVQELQVLAISQPLDKGMKYPAMGVYQGKAVSLFISSHPQPVHAIIRLNGQMKGFTCTMLDPWLDPPTYVLWDSKPPRKSETPASYLCPLVPTAC